MVEMKNSTILKTPKDSLTFLMLTFFVYVTAPIFEWLNLQDLLTSGKLPPNADSIGLGFAFFLFSWVLGLPFVLAFTYWVLWKYPPRVSLFGFNSARLIWSLIWTVIFGFLIYDCMKFVFLNYTDNYFAGVLENLLLAYFFMVIRASIVFRKGEI